MQAPFRFNFQFQVQSQKGSHPKACAQRDAESCWCDTQSHSHARLRRQQNKGTSGSNLLSTHRLSHVWPRWVRFTFAYTNLDPCAPCGLGNCSEHLLPVSGQSSRVQQNFSCCQVPQDKQSPPTSTLAETGTTAKN